MRKDSSSSTKKEGKDKAEASSDRFMNHIPFTTEQFKEVCASNTRPIRFVAIRQGGDIVQDVIIPVTVNQRGPLGLAIKTDTDGAVLVKQVPTSAMEACKQLRPGDILAHPSADDFPNPVSESENSSIKHPTIEIIYKGVSTETPSQKKEEASLLTDDTSKKASSRLRRSMTNPTQASPPPSEVDVSGSTFPSSKNIEDTVKPKDEGIDVKEPAEEQRVSPPIAQDACAESLCSIPRIKSVAKPSTTCKAVGNLKDISKTKAPPTMSKKIHQPMGRPNGQSKSQVIKSRVVPFNSNQPGIEEEYFKDVATKHAEGSANPSALFGVLPRLEGTSLIRLPNIFPSTGPESSSVDQRNDDTKHVDADVTKPSAEEASAREPPDAGQKSDIDKALLLPPNDTKAAPAADGLFSGMGVLASHYLSNLQKSKDKAAQTKAMFNTLAEEKCQDQNNESKEHISSENHELSASNSVSSPACNCNAEGDQQVPEANAVKSTDSASTCIRYSVKVTKGMKKPRTHRRKKTVTQGRH